MKPTTTEKAPWWLELVFVILVASMIGAVAWGMQAYMTKILGGLP